MTRNVFSWTVVVLLVFGVGFGPSYVAHKTQDATFDLSCQAARAERADRQAVRLTLESEYLIAEELGLPVAERLLGFLENYAIPEVPEACAP